MYFSKAQKILKAHQDDLSHYGVRTLAVFGSIARNEGAILMLSWDIHNFFKNSTLK